MNFCSIIIPTLNRSSLLKKTLESIVLFGHADQFEVIVVDNGSIDDTKEMCLADWPFELLYIRDEVPGSLTGRHRGLLESNGDILCFIDDDISLNPGWMDTVLYTMGYRPDIDLMTGPVFPNYESMPPDWVEHFWYELDNTGKFCSYLSLLDLGDAVKEIDPNLVWSLNFCIRRYAFETLKGFHPDYVPMSMFQGDGETGLTMKAVSAGMKALYHPGMEIRHYVSNDRLTIDYFGKRAYFQGICDSFSSLRKYGPPSFFGKLLWDLRSKFKKNSGNFKNNLMSDEAREIASFAEQKYTEGFQFHQTWFKKSQVVREWVLRDNYLDYKLPVI